MLAYCIIMRVLGMEFRLILNNPFNNHQVHIRNVHIIAGAKPVPPGKSGQGGGQPWHLNEKVTQSRHSTELIESSRFIHSTTGAVLNILQ